MPRLRQLWISYSEIEDYSQLESLYYLKTLWLDFKAGPKFSDLSFLTFSPNLKELGLGGANLEGLTGIEQARNLENLTAWEGPVSDIAVLADLAHLKNLNLFQQRISDITPLAGLQQLEIVNVAENNLSSLGTVLINWSYPTSFNLSANPLPCSEIEAARANANLTIQFDGDCLQSGEDADNDGISDENDAFPDDPAASVDTDEDGKPDDWNEGKSAADSTSNPALVMDDDDDNDGVPDQEDTFLNCPTNHCVGNGKSILYYYRIGEDFQSFPFYHAGQLTDWPSKGYGVPAAFDFRNETQSGTWIGGAGNEAWQEFVKTLTDYLELRNAEEGHTAVRFHAELEGLNFFLHISSAPGDLVDLQILNRYAKVSRPLEGCRYVDQDYSTNKGGDPGVLLWSSDLRLGPLPSTPELGSKGAGRNEFLVCADEPVGTKTIKVVALDGRGGLEEYELTVEVMGEKVDGGAIKWFKDEVAAGAVTVSVDSDGDGVFDTADSFPDDPAASVDTDGDGKTDDWNEGRSAADSTSDPALVLDDDDDNDGVLDSNDAYPLDAARTIFDLDDDRVADGADNCPAIVNADQSDIDDDLLGDVCDDDIDGDSCPNAEDAYPTDPKRCELGVQKAIIVAGGGPYSANFLWEATERMAELSIKTLKAQGIEEDHIYYLSAGFGDVYTPDGPATAASVRAAIVDWTQEGNPADDVLIYLVDHGGFEVFELAQKEQLGASDLDGWLDELQASLPGQLTVVYDACQSGSFIPVLRPDDGQDRLVLTSSGADERAHFAARGDVSFSFHFWSNFLIGGDIYRSFVAGSGAMNAIFNRKQNAEIEVDGDGVANAKRDKELARAFSFGQGVALASDVPFIGRVSEPIFLEGQGSVAIEAFDVVGSSKVVRVWALVDTPDDIILPVDEPLTNIGLVELINPNGDGNWTGLFEGAATKGVYEFKVFAQNQDGLYSSPPVDGSNTIIVVQKSGRAPQVGRDSDQDGILDQFDPFPSDPRYGLDGDADLIPDVVDPDRDGDDVRDDYQGKDIFEVALEPELMGYVVQDADEVFATFHDADDVDRFIVIGLKGEQLTLNVRAQADAVDGPDFTLAIVDAAGAVLRVGNEKLFVDDALQAQAETLTFTVPETGRYIAQIGQAQLQTDPGYVTGARSEYALLLRSDRKRLSDVDVAAELTGLRYRAEGLAWRQPLAVTEASRFGFNGQLHLLVPEGVAVIGYPEGQCELSGPLLSCRAETADSLAAQLVAESSGVRELALYAVQNDEAAQRSKEPIAADNLKVLRFVVSEDQDLDGLPDDYERMRGTDPRLDDAFADIDRDGTTNLDEYLSGFDPFSLNTDADSDGRRDDLDAFPRDAAEWSDFDGDGIGDNADADDDGDGIDDLVELADGTNPFDRFSCLTGCFSFDVDQSLDASPLTDGLLVIRFLFGFEGEALTNGAVGTAAERADAESVASYLGSARQALDIDGDGDAKALTDGLLLIRYLFGFEGDALISGAIGRDATRKDAASVEAYIEARLGVGG